MSAVVRGARTCGGAQALVNPVLWEIQYAPHRGVYAEHTRAHRAVDAFRAFNELEVRNGERKRLLRDGRVIDRVTAPLEITPTPAIQEELPIAL